MKLMRLMIDAEFEKIMIMILLDRDKITAEITKKQREILDALHMCA